MLTIRRYTPADQAAVEYLHVFVIQQAEVYLGRGPWDDDVYAIEEHYLNNNGEFLIMSPRKEVEFLKSQWSK